jgi:ArsR family transcriptional regulator, arsenate/arsenite/antimonite-responsive transcriptional repressor
MDCGNLPAVAMIELPVRQRGVCCDLELAVQPAETAEAVELLKALADPTRLSMAATLRRHGEPVCICDLVAVFGLSQPTISHHVAVLKSAGLVTVEKRGLWGFYSLNPDLPAAAGRILDALLESA